MKIFRIIGILILITSCKEDPILLKNGLTKVANKITETFVKVKIDSMGLEIHDTISITEKLYNSENKITQRKQNALFDNSQIEIEYKYNELGLIKQEIVWMSYDSNEITVNYNYQDTILKSTSSKSESGEISFSQNAEYFYHINGKQKKIKTNYVLIFAETSDTTFKQDIDYFNKEGIITKSENVNSFDSKSNKYTIYKYKKNILCQAKEFNFKDSLISKTNFIYELDDFGNWIEKKSIQNGKPVFKTYRKINYK